MIAHPMKYVAMARAVAEELVPETSLEIQLREIAGSITDAESAIVREYRTFRNLLRDAAAQGNARAAHYLEETTWDLT